ncbi:zinc finger MYM-type protein 1-like [Salvia hispanica]|uniref:zinc finger MYM-type protein 1-like n=1 Tax=Salvia hispanica TaxID=49212 RepID=UPI002009C0FC|nr:zinc finger MYM-type protein 1-like [Salvia hispanica]
MDDLGEDYFAILADESSDVSQKEQLALCLRYVDKKSGRVVERFIGLMHVADTTALSLRSAILALLAEHSLSPSKIRGQGYDGASNMKGEIHGLKTLIMEDTPSAYYIHCFAHQLQLTLVAISKRNDECIWLFDAIANLLNVIGVSWLNQELGLKRPGDTRWSSHYKTLLNVMDLFSAIVNVLVIIGKNGSSDDKPKAQGVLRDQDIINAMRLVNLTKDQLQKMRNVGWEIQLNKVIDLLLQELDNRFDEVNMELIRCMACFNPKDNFSSFDKEKLILILPVATASVERVFSGMTFVKNKLRNRRGDQSLNDCLVTFIEKDIFLQVSDDAVVKRFEEMKTRRKIN